MTQTDQAQWLVIADIPAPPTPPRLHPLADPQLRGWQAGRETIEYQGDAPVAALDGSPPAPLPERLTHQEGVAMVVGADGAWRIVCDNSGNPVKVSTESDGLPNVGEAFVTVDGTRHEVPRDTRFRVVDPNEAERVEFVTSATLELRAMVGEATVGWATANEGESGTLIGWTGDNRRRPVRQITLASGASLDAGRLSELTDRLKIPAHVTTKPPGAALEHGVSVYNVTRASDPTFAALVISRYSEVDVRACLGYTVEEGHSRFHSGERMLFDESVVLFAMAEAAKMRGAGGDGWTSGYDGRVSLACRLGQIHRELGVQLDFQFVDPDALNDYGRGRDDPSGDARHGREPQQRILG